MAARGNTMATYDEAMAGFEVSEKEARREVEKHGIDWQEFVEEMGRKDYYDSAEVLAWLGY